MSASRTAGNELAGFLATKLSPDDLIAFNAFVHSLPDLQRWLSISNADRVRILEEHEAVHARHRLNMIGGPS